MSVNGGTRAATSAKLIFEGERERDEKEHQQEQQRRQDDQPAAGAPVRFHGDVHLVLRRIVRDKLAGVTSGT